MTRNQEQRMEIWKAHIKRWRESQKSRLEYCRENGIKDHQLRYWVGRIEGKKKPQKSAFVKAVAKKRDGLEAPSSKSKARLLFPSGVALEFSELPQPSWLASLAGEVR